MRLIANLGDDQVTAELLGGLLEKRELDIVTPARSRNIMVGYFEPCT